MFIGRYGYKPGESCCIYAYFMQKEALRSSRRLAVKLVVGYQGMGVFEKILVFGIGNI